jgi:hypothetical protein
MRGEVEHLSKRAQPLSVRQAQVQQHALGVRGDDEGGLGDAAYPLDLQVRVMLAEQFLHDQGVARVILDQHDRWRGAGASARPGLAQRQLGTGGHRPPFQ